MKFKTAIIVVVPVAAVIAFFFLSPFIVLRLLSEAARYGDRDTMASNVDFPAVRENLKVQLSGFLAARALTEGTGKRNSLADLLTQVMPAVGNQVIDAIVTPDGIATILMRHAGQSGDSPAKPSLWRGQFSWLDLNHFQARYANARHAKETFRITLEHRGAFGWKVVEIYLPLEELLK
jgi:hypothetical protein